jgi:hypothetical protein
MSLASHEKLIYINSNRTFTDTSGIIYIGQALQKQDNFYTLKLIVDQLGNFIHDDIIITVSEENILSDRPVHSLRNKFFYHGTSSSGFGSGIHGIYITNKNQLENYMVADADNIYKIKCYNPYIIQDVEHGNSLTVASLQTSRYIDKILNFLKSYDEIEAYVDYYPFDNIVRLWNMTFLRTHSDFIDENFLREIFITYITNFFIPSEIFDSRTREPLTVQPINYIMVSLGYDGIMFDHNIGWDKYCVSYNIDYAQIFSGSHARLKYRGINA